MLPLKRALASRRLVIGAMTATVLLLALAVGLSVGLRPPDAGRPPTAAATAPSSQLVGTKASVLTFPTQLQTATPCDAQLAWDLGCNAWWLREDAWATYQARASADIQLLQTNLPAGGNTTGILYWPLFLADPIHAGLGLSRLNTIITTLASSGLRVILFIGRPEYYGNGTSVETGDPVHDPTAWARFTSLLRSTLAVPAVQQHVQWVSVYWMSAFCVGHGAGFCTVPEITSFNTRLQVLVHAAGAGGARGRPFSYLQHVDGPFWEGCWPQPCDPAAWNVGGYGPSSLQGLDGLMGESWVQGSLKGAVSTLWASGAFNTTNTLLLTDVPNCDLYPSTHPCSSSPSGLAQDDATWFQWLSDLGLRGTWGVWDSVDGGLADPTPYGDVKNDGSGLTAKGQLRRQAVLDGK